MAILQEKQQKLIMPAGCAHQEAETQKWKQHLKRHEQQKHSK